MIPNLTASQSSISEQSCIYTPHPPASSVAMDSPEATWVVTMMERLEKLELENDDLQSRLAKLEPPSTPFPVQLHPRPKDIYFEVAVYMDNLPTLGTMGRSLTEQTGVTSLTLLPAVTFNMKWTVEDNRPKGVLEGVVEHPCTMHQLSAAIFLAWKAFLVPEPGICRLQECQPQFWTFWTASARWEEGSVIVQSTEHRHHFYPSYDGRTFIYGAMQDAIRFRNDSANDTVRRVMDDLHTFSGKFIDLDECCFVRYR